ncbi:pimeloyl-ACP methyl ester carboxylesterase [Thermocatellispora tengchongensis]|uniref:Pimeloyl-ACP methyl ester carboxylesterase n=1 Tax=Thermocatellispora tengchongensis TaxID=1073253 RepID=A0A840P1P8_9ACTN|nr:alpha/beta hydrolase [Thermocatellispora tengchongensis]MBB5132909.1 pimeloyl-ACP methyl ester carboxylesterase [Thermocatellispora tengchongensis]
MIAVRKGGQGGPRLVFVHGGSGSWRMGAELLFMLSPHVRWWAVDLPGHGDSPPGRYDVEGVAAVLAEWARAELDGPAWWYGHSYGGQVALATAAACREAFAGLVIGDAPLSAQAMYRLVEQSSERLRRWRDWCGRPESELLGLLGAESAGERTYAELFGLDHPYLTGMAYSLHRHDPAFLDALLDDREGVYGCLDRSGDWLEAVPGPVSLLRGDPAVLALSSERDAMLVREHGGTVRTVDGVGHSLHQTAPAVIADILMSFIHQAVPKP